MDLKTWRKKKGLSQQELAALIGVTHPVVCHIERGTRAASLKTAQKIEALTDGLVRVKDIVDPKRVKESLEILGIK